MHPVPSMTQDPYDRFHEIYQNLDGDTYWWSDGAWLRFAAQAAILGSASPGETARAIRDMADQLQQHVQWYNVLSSPLNLVVAAILVQRNETVESFNDEMAVAAGFLREAGLTLGGSSLVKAVLIMHFLGDGAAASKAGAQRVSQVYAIMKRNHWWITGCGDVCACALLAANSGLASVIEGMAEEIYHRLIDHGLNRGHHVLIAANILTLANIPATTDCRSVPGADRSRPHLCFPVMVGEFRRACPAEPP